MTLAPSSGHYFTWLPVGWNFNLRKNEFSPYQKTEQNRGTNIIITPNNSFDFLTSFLTPFDCFSDIPTSDSLTFITKNLMNNANPFYYPSQKRPWRWQVSITVTHKWWIRTMWLSHFHLNTSFKTFCIRL